MPKEKVTFTIDAKVIEKARKLNVNLSQIAETVLRSFAYRAKSASKKQVYEGYRLLFCSCSLFLQNIKATWWSES